MFPLARLEEIIVKGDADQAPGRMSFGGCINRPK
jgi:hypothetical protein